MNVCLVLKKKGGARKPFTLPDSVTVIGRRQECDLCIPLMVVSRRHCQINLDEGKLRIRDLGSRNGTYVNGQRVEETELSPGDEIRIGPLQFSVQIDGVPADDSDILSPPTHIAEAEQGASEVQEVGVAADAQDKDDPFADLDDLDDLDELINLDDMDSAIDTMRDSMGDVSQKAQEDEQRPI